MLYRGSMLGERVARRAKAWPNGRMPSGSQKSRWTSSRASVAVPATPRRRWSRRYGAGLLYLLKRRTRDSDLCPRPAARHLPRGDREAAQLAPRRAGAPGRVSARCGAQSVDRASAQERAARDRTSIRKPWRPRRTRATSGPFDNVSREQVRDAVGVLLAELGTPRDREILTRLYLRDEDKDDICDALGVDSTHFNRVLFRAKQRFRELLVRADRRNKLRLVG